MSDLNNSLRQEGSGGQVEHLLQENLRYNRAIFAEMKKVKRFMLWRTIFSVIWLVLFVVPVILSLIYLPSFLNNFYKNYQDLMTGSQGVFDLANQLKQVK